MCDLFTISGSRNLKRMHRLCNTDNTNILHPTVVLPLFLNLKSLYSKCFFSFLVSSLILLESFLTFSKCLSWKMVNVCCCSLHSFGNNCSGKKGLKRMFFNFPKTLISNGIRTEVLNSLWQSCLKPSRS